MSNLSILVSYGTCIFGSSDNFRVLMLVVDVGYVFGIVKLLLI